MKAAPLSKKQEKSLCLLIVLTKIATGAYKNLAGAAGAKHLTRMALVKAWDAMVYGHITSALTMALIKSGAITLGGTIGIAFLPL